MISARSLSKLFFIFSACIFIFMVIIGIGIFTSHDGDMVFDHDDDVTFNGDPPDNEEPIENWRKAMYGPTDANVAVPIVLWWTYFTGERGQTRRCGSDRCFFTNNRNYYNHSKVKVFVFYGTSFRGHDLPVPRLHHHEWALLHEESPKNVFLFSHASIMSLFNHTCTFRRESDYPIITQYLPSIKWLLSKKHMLSVEEKSVLRRNGLALISYTHSDCDTASDRDTYVKHMMKIIPVDSYGACIHNKDLPEHLRDPIKGMEHEDFYKHQARYKFTFAFENSICNDYVTEKLWRALHIGSVPVVYGSPKVEDILPKHSAILASNFNSIAELVNYLEYLDRHDEEYEKYLAWKTEGIQNEYLLSLMSAREWNIDNDPDGENFIDRFECFVCNRISENIRRQQKGVAPIQHIANLDHYGCPRPLKFDAEGKRVNESQWALWWDESAIVGRSVQYLISQNVSYGRKELDDTIDRFTNELG